MTDIGSFFWKGRGYHLVGKEDHHLKVPIGQLKNPKAW